MYIPNKWVYFHLCFFRCITCNIFERWNEPCEFWVCCLPKRGKRSSRSKRGNLTLIGLMLSIWIVFSFSGLKYIYESNNQQLSFKSNIFLYWVSQFAGAGQSLGAGALLVNPWNVKEVSNAIGEALSMSREEKEKKHQINFQYVKTHSTQQWADDFMKYVTNHNIHSL